MANLFKSESNSRDLERKLVAHYKIEIDTARQIIFLIHFEELDENNVFDFYKAKVKCHITNETILEWLRVTNKNRNVFYSLWKFLEYKPSISADDLMSKGFKPGKALGDEIKRLEIDKFKEMVNGENQKV